MNLKKDVKQIAAFTVRNIKLFFKDKGTLIGALIAPLIIMMLYALFLHRVFLQTFDSTLEGIILPAKTVNGLVASYEVSSVLSVCCVTVAFVANMNMVADRVSGARADITVTPAKGHVLVLGYYFATAVVTLAICYITMLAGFCYIAGMGWAMTAGEALSVVFDVFLATLFGTALSSVVCFFLRSSGSINAVSTIVSSVYGFICGAYYPISKFSKGMANVIMCLPGTYCTGLLRSHFMSGYASLMTSGGAPQDVIDGLFSGFDVRLSFFGSDVKTWTMYLVVACTVLLLIAAFVVINIISAKRSRKSKMCITDKAK
ncbi:MAG: ABC transporter permease [Clostridiales bacterium]|nr:ABC transporter permease [Clostridiales bacterium]